MSYDNYSGNLTLSEDYNDWLSRQSQSSYDSRKLKIVFPKDNDYFLINPNESSRLEFKLSGISATPVEWSLNGKKLDSQPVNSLFWQLKPGEWTLQVKAGKMTDKVKFEVRVPDNKSQRRGFSFIGSSASSSH